MHSHPLGGIPKQGKNKLARKAKRDKRVNSSGAIIS